MVQYESFDPELEEYNRFEVIDPTIEETESEKSSLWKEEILEKGYRSFIFD